jgi:FRG domain
MDTKQTLVTNLASLESAIEDLQGSFDGEALWWRGHRSVNWDLEAGVFRPGPNGNKYSEHALASHFQARALGMLGHRSKPSSELEWLFLAQHYGLPTRLLDWTENPLVALHFAVRQEQGQKYENEDDGCIWVLSPSHLNQENSCPADPSQAQFGLISSDERVVRAMAEQAFGLKEEVVKQRLGFDPSLLPTAIAIESPEIDARIIAQSGRFTLHGCPSALVPTASNAAYLRKLVIPASAKPFIRQRLDWLGLRVWNLFPDLQSLAQGLRDHDFASNPSSVA